MSSSVVFVAVVAFWLLGVAPTVLNRRIPARAVPTVVTDGGPQVLPAADPPGTEDAGSKEDETVPMDEAEKVTLPRPAVRKPRIRTGRASVALLGAVALVAAPVMALLAVFSVVSSGAPVICLAVTAACVASLRTLAKRDRLRRVQRAFEEAMAPDSQEVRGAVVPERPRNSPIAPFDHRDGAPEATTAAPPPLTAAELREAALAVAREIGDSLPAEETTWEPVEVPKPLYVDAPKAERPSPEPLNLPESPKPEGKPIIKDALKPDLAQALQDGDPTVTVVNPGQPALKNLDAVLKRRRA
ncbi:MULTISPECIES: hypothetical protein [Arthrobacter]|uniref:Uncharacterized protein n=2 Tax=Arthrobacter TaxID=1663 RepID=A0ABU9KKE2_9MICC|nr:hypothetical protein [Arthrobacter sp. YJM1]MDP5227071.1 hypothetical protein [Arthrobacter sp. YJM1]